MVVWEGFLIVDRRVSLRDRFLCRFFFRFFLGLLVVWAGEDAGDAERWRSCEDLLLALVGVWVDGFRGLVLEGESRLRAESESST
jgi:hypothetical protein